jgi:nitrogen-specific signal transduction histidine kinase
MSRCLFDAFVADEAGTGLGLALVDRKIGELGGSVQLVNEPDHIVFRVCLDSSGTVEEK